MGIRLFNWEFETVGSIICALTSVLLIVLALVLLIEFGEYVIRQLFTIF